MPMRYLLAVEGGSLKVHGKERIVKGDGRVPKESAVNKEFREIGTGHIYALDAGHGELLSDPKFTEFIDEVELIIQRDKALEIGAYVASEADLRRQLSAERFLISPTPAGVSSISVSEADKKAVASLNLETVASLAEEASPRAAKKVGRELEDGAGNTAAARVVYRSGDVLSAEATDARTLNRLGYILYREKKFSEAAAVLKKAAERAESTKDPYLTDELKGKIYGNLGTALFHAGFLGEARRAYEKGAAKGNPIAQYNLGLLMKLRTPAE
jgi:tetratricopeptide (TPR) repeat protein